MSEVTKEQLMKVVKEWVKLDNEIRVLQKEITNRKKEKKEVSTQLMQIMKSEEIGGLDINDGQILYTKKTVKKPMTNKVLMDVLSKFYGGDFMKASEMNSYIMENRGELIKENIIRKIKG
jgi:seryl-tRNA synthetase